MSDTIERKGFLTKADSMNAAFTLDLLLHSPPHQSICLVGDHGVGKDGIILEAANILQCPLIDIRLSQNDVGDLKGMPWRVKGRTLFAPPDWMPLEDEEYNGLEDLMDHVDTSISKSASADRGILFFNELNRTSREVQQTVMQVALARMMGTRKIKDGWRIAAAINGDQHYITTQFDLALKSRFRLVKFRPSVQEWLEWAIRMDLHEAVIEFIRRYHTMLDPSDTMLQEASTTLEMQVRNRRAWEMLSDDIKLRVKLAAEGKVPDPLDKSKDSMALMQLRAMTYMDSMASIQFCSFLQSDYEALSGDTILNKWDKTVEKKVKEVIDGGRHSELMRYCDMIVETIGDSNINAKQKANLTTFFGMLNRESRVRFYKSYLHESKKSCLDWYEDKEVRELITEALKNEAAAPTT